MRKLIWLVIALTTAYSGYWFAGSYGALRGARLALEQIKAEGRGDYADVTLAGFPSRFDLTVDKPSLVSADGLLRWSAPFVQVLALSYQPNKVIAVWPHEQTITAGSETMTLRTEDMKASVTFGAVPSLPLEHSELVARPGALAAASGWSVAFDGVHFATRRDSSSPTAHEIGLTVINMRPVGLGLPAPFDSGSVEVKTDATATFDRAIDRTAEGALLTAVSLRSAAVTWGKTAIDATGDLTVTAAGIPEGRITLKARGWQDVLSAAVALGAVKPELAPTVSGLLTQMQKASPDPAVLEVPLVFASGRMSLGPIPLGPAPRFPGYRQ